MQARSSSLAGRLLTPLESTVWILFLVWTAIGFAVMPFYLGEAQIREWVANPGLQEALVRFVAMTDAIWIVLAAAVTYLHLAHADGIRTARRWSLMILVTSALLASVGTLSDIPFGPLAYTNRLGVRLLQVLPFTLPLLWLVIVAGARCVTLAIKPTIGRLGMAMSSGFVALLTDLNLEPVAWKVRAYWIWYPALPGAPDIPPVQNYITWFITAALLAAAYPAPSVPLRNSRRFSQPVVVLLLINALLLTTNCARWLDR